MRLTMILGLGLSAGCLTTTPFNIDGAQPDMTPPHCALSVVLNGQDIDVAAPTCNMPSSPPAASEHLAVNVSGGAHTVNATVNQTDGRSAVLFPLPGEVVIDGCQSWDRGVYSTFVDASHWGFSLHGICADGREIAIDTFGTF